MIMLRRSSLDSTAYSRSSENNERTTLYQRTVMNNDKLLLVGWREWVQLSTLGLTAIKAKIDTGARTSALHAFEVRPFEECGVQRLEFKIHPQQRNTEKVVTCVADVVDQRVVADSGGHKENRWVIKAPLTMAGDTWPIEITLTSRDDMRFRMLLGRSAMNGRIQVDSASSYLLGRKRNLKKMS